MVRRFGPRHIYKILNSSMTVDFVHLRVHTEFSLVDSLVRIKPLVKQVADLGMPACALTDHSNFYGLIKFYKAAQKAGVKPIAGSDFWLLNDDPEGKPSQIGRAHV